MIYEVIVADILWLIVSLLLLDLAKAGKFGWKHHERLVFWLRGLSIYIVIEMFLHKVMEDGVARIVSRLTEVR